MLPPRVRRLPRVGLQMDLAILTQRASALTWVNAQNMAARWKCDAAPRLPQNLTP